MAKVEQMEQTKQVVQVWRSYLVLQVPPYCTAIFGRYTLKAKINQTLGYFLSLNDPLHGCVWRDNDNNEDNKDDDNRENTDIISDNWEQLHS